MLYYLIEVAHDWALRSFGQEQMTNEKTRALRLVEEAIELCQAVGVSENDVHQTLTKVYTGEPGDPVQELGGVFLTAFLMSKVMRVPAIEVFVKELRRVLGKDPAIWAARNANKVNVTSPSMRTNWSRVYPRHPETAEHVTAAEAEERLDKAVAALPALDKDAVDFVVPKKYTVGFE